MLAVLTKGSVCVYACERVSMCVCLCMCVCVRVRVQETTFLCAWELVAVLHYFSLFFNFCGDVYCKIRTWFSVVKLCVRVHACVCVCVHACVCADISVSVWLCVCVYVCICVCV